MKFVAVLIVMSVLTALPALADTVAGEEDAGTIGPEDGPLYAFDIVGDNIASFLSRIGTEESHANMVRRLVAERRTEHLRLQRLKMEGKVSADSFAKKDAALQRRISAGEANLQGRQTATSAQQNAAANKQASPGQSGTARG